MRRRFTVVAMICAYLLTAFGVPVSARVDKSGEPFPCQHHACGCQTAEQCWNDCCCYSHATKMAWAKKHGVRPPLQATHASQASSARDHADGSCCTSHDTPRACCSDKADRSARADREPSSATDGESRVTASKCRSIATMWCMQGGGLPPPSIDWQFEWISLEWLRTLAGSLNSLDRLPPVPPPRV